MCSLCGIFEEITEINAKKHFRKHLMENNIDTCRLSLINRGYENPDLPYSLVEDLHDQKIDVALVFIRNQYHYHCEPCVNYYKVAGNYLKHVSQQLSHPCVDTKYRHISDVSNIWCKICRLKIKKFEYIKLHASKAHLGTQIVHFELFPALKLIENGNGEPAKKKLKL